MPLPFKFEAYSRSANSAPNRHVGSRFSEEGVFLPEAGNTVVRHVVPGSETQAALIELRERLRALPWGHRFVFTDVPSLHMTVFEGAIETRREEHYWPGGLPLDAELEAVTEHLAGGLEGFEGPGPFDMRIFEVTPFGLTLSGATGEDEQTARAWRDALTEPFGYRSPGHDDYVFHVTLAYIIELAAQRDDCGLRGSTRRTHAGVPAARSGGRARPAGLLHLRGHERLPAGDDTAGIGVPEVSKPPATVASQAAQAAAPPASVSRNASPHALARSRTRRM
jgi:hypothetical protein